MDITNAVNASLRSVNDLVSLPSIDDGAFLHRMDQSKEKIKATLEQLHQFDRKSTSRLEKAEKDLSLMQNYIREINSMIKQGGLSVVNYSPRKLQDLEIHQVMIHKLRKKAGNNAFSLDTLAQSVLSRYVPLSEILIKHLHEKYNRRTIDYSVSALQAITTAGNNVISQNEFTTLQGNVIKSVEVTDYLGERHGNYLTLSDGRMLRTYED
ncbi:T7SS effector LXG polymorphic toxin, partial [Oceanobacillus saliphilus]|uniref:T7SS effector LXG polymorphic toxin n=1 Tax=Oceanobacillus saliphilus TaxID=2925834 RepID=UPI00201E0B60